MGESNIVVETAERIFADLCDPQTVNSAKDDNWKDALWKALTENGLTLPWIPEEHGGAGAELADGFELLSAAGRFAVPVPLAETMLAGWLLSQGGIVHPKGRCRSRPCSRRTGSR